MYNILNLTSCKKFFILLSLLFILILLQLCLTLHVLVVFLGYVCLACRLLVLLYDLILIQPHFFILSLFFLSSFFNLFTFYRTLLAGSVSAAFLLSHPLVSGKPQITFKVGTDY